MAQTPVTIFWFRRDLRLEDNAGLHHALLSGAPVLPLFIFDLEILDKLRDRSDRRVAFIHAALQRIHNELKNHGSGLLVKIGRPLEIWEKLLSEYKVVQVYANEDYEPDAIRRDEQVGAFLQSHGIPFHTSKDHVIFARHQVVKENGAPYTVYTPYKNKWLSHLTPDDVAPCNCQDYLHGMLPQDLSSLPPLSAIGFKESNAVFSEPLLDEQRIRVYHQQRDTPAVAGTSRLSEHLRFGTISIRHLVRQARAWNQIWLQELIWREFFAQILCHFPHVVDQPFKRAYAAIPWRENHEEFTRWCLGETGYPIVDAGMRELNHTGFMHNRVRMITAGFLCKHLLLPWLWGERYFAEKLLDYDLASNNGNWQWAAGCGCDAAPYFRVFNPDQQTQKFDPQRRYIKRWVPEVDSAAYPQPMVNHTAARIRAISTYRQALASKKE